jgi:hypothetical protein
VCGGTLLVTAGHFAYMNNGMCGSYIKRLLTQLGDGPKAISFLVGKLRG